MKTNIKAVAAAIIVVTFIAGNAFAGTECGFSKQRDKGSKGKYAITRELNLSEDQQTRLEQEKTAHRKTMETLRNALKEKRREFRDAIAKPDITRQQIEPILTQIKALQSDMADKRADGIFAVKEILTPEQFAKLRSINAKKMQAGHKKRNGKGRK